MIGIILLLAALGVTALLGGVLVVLIRSKLREREELARMNQPSVPAPQAVEALAAPRKPSLTPWLVVSGIIVVVVTLVGGMLLRSCQVIGEGNARDRERSSCRQSMDSLAGWFYGDWGTRKALPPAGAVSVDSYARNCPLGNRFKYLGGSEILLGKERVLVVETGTHRIGGGNYERHAIVADPKFLGSGQTGEEFQAAAAGSGGRGYAYYGEFFKVRTLTEAEYATIRQAVEDAP